LLWHNFGTGGSVVCCRAFAARIQSRLK
jgi:hypothetical protein